MKKILFAALSVVALAASLHAQTLRGEIRDLNSTRRLEGALVVFSMPNKTEISTFTNDEGKFEIEPLPAGYGILSVQLKNYARYQLPFIEIATGKQQVLEIFLTPETQDAVLDPVDIIAQRPMQTVLPIGATILPKEQTLNYPVTYYDPARLATAVAPGVAQGDDGTNAMSVRGNNPAYVRWKLNGLDIVSPNHLPNAGTLSDQATPASGGVLMLSAQMLDHAALVTGPGAIEYNDGVGGVMDLRLRKGNTQRHEQTIQAGLIGMDATVEGPLGRKGNGNSYLINYRYSTVGLLGKMGVSFGGEKITFQDLAVHLALKGIIRGEWSFFFLGGKSENQFSRPDSAQTYKDLFNIDFDSKTLVTGFSKRNSWGTRHATQFGMCLSTQYNDHDQSSLTEYIGTQNQSVWWSLQNSHRIAFNSNMALSFGYHLRFFNEDYSREYFTSSGSASAMRLYDERYPFQGWIRLENYWLNGKLGLIGGVHPVSDDDIESFRMCPRLQAFWRPSPAHHWIYSLSTGAQSRPILDRSQEDYFYSALHAVRYKYQPGKRWSFSAEAYWQSLTGQSVSVTPNAFSGFNEAETSLFNIYYLPEGNARMKGLELTARRDMAGGWFAQANATLMQSEYQGSDAVWRRSRWDVGHIANVMGGKEWTARRYKEGKARYRGFSGRAVWRGGFRNAPVDLVQSEQKKATVYDYSNGLPLQEKDYFRIDARFYWKRHIYGRYTSIMAVEVQNLTAQKNIAWHYYDALDHTVKIKYQLGMIPNLSWRWHF